MSARARASDDRSVYAALKTMTLEPVFPPGLPLQVGDLADRLRVSATPVREALARLSAERLVRAVPPRGFRARPLEIAEMTALLDLTALLVAHLGGRDTRRALARGMPAGSSGTSAASAAPINGTALSDAEDPARARAARAAFEGLARRAANQPALEVLENALDRTHCLYVSGFDRTRPGEDLWQRFLSLERALAADDIGANRAPLDAFFDHLVDEAPRLLRDVIARTHAR